MVIKSNNPNYDCVTVELTDFENPFSGRNFLNKFKGAANPCKLNLPNLLITIDFKQNVIIEGQEFPHVQYICDLKNNDCRAEFYSDNCFKELYSMSVEALERYLKIVSCPEELLTDSEREERKKIAAPICVSEGKSYVY